MRSITPCKARRIGVAVGVGVGVLLGLGVEPRRLVIASKAEFELCSPIFAVDEIVRGDSESVFPGIASSPVAQSRMPSEAGILKTRVPHCFRCTVKTRGLKKANAERDFVFI
jgi:hypothetical protein